MMLKATIYLTADSSRPRACLVIFGAFTCAFCTVGFMNSFGIFQEYYTKNQLSSSPTSTIAWLGAIAIFLLFAISVGAGAMLDIFGPTVRILFLDRWERN
jgi:F0F1-type ATP synthase membrane subunit a